MELMERQLVVQYVLVSTLSNSSEAALPVAHLRDVVDAEGWRQLVSVREGDLVGGSFQGDLSPQEETVPQCVPV